MQSYTNASSSARLERQRHQLEQLWQAPQRSFPGGKQLKQFGSWLLAVLTPTDSLTIRETSNGWSVQEAGQMRHFDSEDAVRIWLEQRHLKG